MIQFLRLSNCYFLSTAIMNAIPGFSAITPASTFAPLCFVIMMSVMREAYEDYVRIIYSRYMKIIEKDEE
jgi:phospholipid-transporting ATPase